jgi:hypothetical protein
LKKGTTYIYLLAAIYFAVGLIGICHHELWLDEAHHWLLARDSNSVFELIQNTRMEGHPLLWSFILYGISRFTTDPFWMQFAHLLVSVSVVFLFLKKAPFDWAFKILFIFGYFMVFEYNLISRNYILGIFFLFLACTFFQNRGQKFSLVCLCLALATNSHLLFGIPALALFLALLAEQIQNRQLLKRPYFAGYLIFGLGLLSVYVQIHSTDSNWLLDPINKLSFQERMVGGFGSFFKGLITIPDFRTMHFWNSNLIVNLGRPIAGLLALLIYLLPLLLFFKNRKTLFFVYTALIGTQIFFFITQRSATRFDGITYIIIIMALWIERYFSSDEYKLKDYMLSWKLTIFQKPIVYCILAIQFFSGVYAYGMDFKYPFTASKATADFIREKKINHGEIVTASCDGTALSPYLEEKVFFLCDGSYQSYCRWNSTCGENNSQDDTLRMISDYLHAHNDFIFVSYCPLYLNEKENHIRIRLLKKFENNILANGNYYVYQISENLHDIKNR